MIQTELTLACNCESCSRRTYHTRSVSRSCANVTQPGDHITQGEEVPRPQVPTPESEIQDPILNSHEDGYHLVSNLFDSVTSFWSLIIRDEALPLSQCQDEERQERPPSPPDTVTNDTTSREGCFGSLENDPECGEVNELPLDAALSDEEEPEARDCTPGPGDSTNQTTFNLETLLLGEELKRLRVWKATFSNDELNRLPFIEHEVAQGILKCLTSVANTLIKGYSEWQASSESQDLEPEKDFLEGLVKQVEERMSEANVDDESMTDIVEFSTQGSACTAEVETPLKALKFDIDRLQMLSHTLRLGLSNGIIFTGHG
ncbi:hypothetical protein CDV31_004058 [Fusarium ambrosium]|uniref:Uncharacterized protein n=1 Tax=Fusarium ambrosium TaxID=131363 RepID=A0A428USA4_9HYPO|nr:hypothetical protein CDV31_004058 [Fusarium ambrosium]